MAAPSMKERQACWGARDEYWKCLDENTEDASRCKKLRSSFESSCPQQWDKSPARRPHECRSFGLRGPSRTGSLSEAALPLASGEFRDGGGKRPRAAGVLNHEVL
ncbi:uncharacterized protein LOC114883285 [Monodon monoceros]|uniref:uncharacterized protein LOC114883285 n=1 Tax=Monodon monoceros TaxID=40151 RepID=UPI0010F5A79A|nr:uncharacterized protein LOC114883285 [Monodon monoceros]